MKSLSQTEYRAREALLKQISELDYTVVQRLAALGLSPEAIARVRALTRWSNPHSTPAALEDVSPWFRVGAQRPGDGGSSGRAIGEINGWTILVWPT